MAAAAILAAILFPLLCRFCFVSTLATNTSETNVPYVVECGGIHKIIML